jgi:hypothetical protein
MKIGWVSSQLIRPHPIKNFWTAASGQFTAADMTVQKERVETHPQIIIERTCWL